MDPALLATLTTPFDAANTGIGIVLPLLVALITNKAANPNLKAVLLFALSVVGSILTTGVLGIQGVGWSGFLDALGTTLTAAVVAHFGFWRKGLGDLLAKYTSSFGIGANVQGSNSSAQPVPSPRSNPEGTGDSRL